MPLYLLLLALSELVNEVVDQQVAATGLNYDLIAGLATDLEVHFFRAEVVGTFVASHELHLCLLLAGVDELGELQVYLVILATDVNR